MFIMKGALMLFISLAIGYVLCILAKKETGVLKTLGYTLGVSIIVLSLLYAAYESSYGYCGISKKIGMHKSMKCPGKFMKGYLR